MRNKCARMSTELLLVPIRHANCMSTDWLARIHQRNVMVDRTERRQSWKLVNKNIREPFKKGIHSLLCLCFGQVRLRGIIFVNVQERVPRLKSHGLDKVDNLLSWQVCSHSAQNQVAEVCICHWLISEPESCQVLHRLLRKALMRKVVNRLARPSRRNEQRLRRDGSTCVAHPGRAKKCVHSRRQRKDKEPPPFERDWANPNICACDQGQAGRESIRCKISMDRSKESRDFDTQTSDQLGREAIGLRPRVDQRASRLLHAKDCRNRQRLWRDLWTSRRRGLSSFCV